MYVAIDAMGGDAAPRAIVDGAIERRRAELGAVDPFNIDPTTVKLRARLLAGDEDLPPLDLVDCLRIAAENSRTYQDRRESLYFEALDLTLEWLALPDAGRGDRRHCIHRPGRGPAGRGRRRRHPRAS